VSDVCSGEQAASTIAAAAKEDGTENERFFM
jgi:hypothetical protein